MYWRFVDAVIGVSLFLCDTLFIKVVEKINGMNDVFDQVCSVF